MIALPRAIHAPVPLCGLMAGAKRRPSCAEVERARRDAMIAAAVRRALSTSAMTPCPDLFRGAFQLYRAALVCDAVRKGDHERSAWPRSRAFRSEEVQPGDLIVGIAVRDGQSFRVPAGSRVLE